MQNQPSDRGAIKRVHSRGSTCAFTMAIYGRHCYCWCRCRARRSWRPVAAYRCIRAGRNLISTRAEARHARQAPLFTARNASLCLRACKCTGTRLLELVFIQLAIHLFACIASSSASTSKSGSHTVSLACVEGPILPSPLRAQNDGEETH